MMLFDVNAILDIALCVCFKANYYYDANCT